MMQTTITKADSQFYGALPAHEMSLHDLLVKDKLFSKVPPDWHVVITDITGSTNAVLGGRHEDVNLIATGSIVSVLNLAFSMDITVPFFFGGDGATFIVPPVLIDKVMHALTLYKDNTLTNFDLTLRAGTVPVAQVYAGGHEIQIAKYSSSATFSIPIVLGDGLSYAEKIIKGDDYMFSDLAAHDTLLDLSGMQCRWDKIPPPADKEEIVTLLIIATNVAKQAVVFKKVLEGMESFMARQRSANPYR